MRCYACNKVLSTQESTRKFASGEYADMCNKCLGTIQEDVNTQEGEPEDEYAEPED